MNMVFVNKICREAFCKFVMFSLLLVDTNWYWSWPANLTWVDSTQCFSQLEIDWIIKIDYNTKMSTKIIRTRPLFYIPDHLCFDLSKNQLYFGLTIVTIRNYHKASTFPRIYFYINDIHAIHIGHKILTSSTQKIILKYVDWI